VPAFLSPEWLEAVRDAVARHEPDGSTGLHAVVTGGPDGDVKVGDPDTAALSFTVPADVLREIIAGSLEPTVAFMQGRLKTAGDTGALFRELARTRSADFAALRREIESLTDP
jgi:putative sterol carrier protein